MPTLNWIGKDAVINTRPVIVKNFLAACFLLLLSGCVVTIPLGDNIKETTRIDSSGNVIIEIEVAGTGTPVVITMVTASTKPENEVEVSSWQQVEPFNFDNLKAIFPDNFEIGFSPVGTPLRIAIDSTGKVLISAEAKFVTPYGVFDITTSKDIIKQSKARLLTIQIDEEVNIYELKNEDFQISFFNNDEYYRILSFEQDKKGNIQLVLESLK